jgi:tRNA 5-methylaminomethyl-2-thiouridine biosynthesis bifunctional protein
MTEPADWSAPIDWSAGAPRSARFDDTYFSAEDGLAETRAVFLEGCGLPDAWAGRRHFTVAELGFGTGLNILALLDLWRSHRPVGGRLHIFSVEAYPMAREDAAQALAHWPNLADLTAPLLAGWPDGRRGWRRIEWPDLGATLDLAVEEVVTAMTGWTGRADAWFLDGFAPSRNPEMWRDEVLALVAARSARGARAASFTVAGAVRRGLEAQGFAVERAPGFGRKKQRLEARLTKGAPGLEPPTPRVAILGAGIAGASLARALVKLGAAPRIFDPGGLGAGASGNSAALVTPRLDAGLGALAELYAQAFARAVDLYRTETAKAVIATGALQLETSTRDISRFDRIAAWDGFAAGALARLDSAAASDRLGEVDAQSALAYRDALTVEPSAILSTWIGDALDRRAVDRLEQGEGGWSLVDTAGDRMAEADIIVIATGHAAGRFAPDLVLRPVRGQASMAQVPFTGAPTAWGGYAIPTRTGLLFGATHDRGDVETDVRDADHVRNLGVLAQGRPAFAARLVNEPLAGRASIRAATPDHLPLAGAIPGMDGVYVLAGLGGRGFTLSPILAEQVAAMALGLGGPLPKRLVDAVNPSRAGRAQRG